MGIWLINPLSICGGAHFLLAPKFGYAARRAAARLLVCGKLASNRSI